MNAPSWVAINETIFNNLNFEQLAKLLDEIKKVFGDRLLDEKTRRKLKDLLHVDDKTAEKWKAVNDVLKYIDPFALAEENPELVKSVLITVFSFIGKAVKQLNTVNVLLAKLPPELISKSSAILGILDPLHMARKAVKIVISSGKRTEEEEITVIGGVSEAALEEITEIISEN